MPLVQTTQPTSPVVSLAEAKEHCRIVATDTTHDTLLARLIVAATEHVEARTGTKLTPVTMRLDSEGFPGGDLVIPVYPVRSITAFVYDDWEGTETALTEDTGGSPVGDYYKYLDGMSPFVRPVSAWPAVQASKPNSVRLTFAAGYAYPSDCPEDMRAAVLVKIKEMFDHGGEVIDGVSVESAVNTTHYLTAAHRRWDA